jgi:hypothetical protein
MVRQVSCYCFILSLVLIAGIVGLSTVETTVTKAIAAEGPATVHPPIHKGELPSIDHRFAADKVEEIPDFQKHVVPAISRLGCNGRACHGSFQGQGGFRLSLFGYDFNMDHEGLAERLDTDTPTESYILQKAMNQVEHKGGQVIKPGSWQHHVVLRWIEAGAKGVPNDTPKKLKTLEVTPHEILFNKDGQSQQLKAVAVWEDGVREDVTPLCRFQSNDSAIAAISTEGLVSSGESGDTYVVAFYDSAVIPIPVLRPVNENYGVKYPTVATHTKVDQLVVNKLRKLGIMPSELAPDTEFLRRVSLDITGTLPTPDEVEAFVNNKNPEKRRVKIDELLARPGYSAWWTTKLCDLTGNNSEYLQNASVDRAAAGQQWYDWIYKRVNDNVPYQELVQGIVMAQGIQKGETYRTYSEEMSREMFDPEHHHFADREGLTHYWARRNFRTPEERAIGFAYTFLGVRIACAQCHKHPFDQWTQDDFVNFQGFFSHTNQVQFKPNNPEAVKEFPDITFNGLKGNELQRALAAEMKNNKIVPFPYLNTVAAKPVKGKPKETNNKNKPRVVKASEASVLGGDLIDLTKFKDPRQPLMDWLISDKNHLLAKSFVNRVWANYFHRGIVEPTDDLSLANPPANAELLNYLTQGFISHNYDMKWLHREITNSATYQASWMPNSTNELDERNFSHAIPRRLPAEIAIDAVKFATASTNSQKVNVTDMDSRTIAMASVGGRNDNKKGGGNAVYSLKIFGRSLRESNCDCDRSMDPNLLQTIYLRNDNDVFVAINRQADGWLAETIKKYHLPASKSPVVAENEKERGKKNGQTPEALSQNLTNMKKRLEKAKKAKDEGTVKLLTKQIEMTEARRVALLKKFREDNDLKPNQTLAEKAGENKIESGKANQAHTTWTSTDAEEVVREAYLRFLSRYPKPQELKDSVDYLQQHADAREGLEGLMWALMNTKEFIVNH